MMGNSEKNDQAGKRNECKEFKRMIQGGVYSDGDVID